MIEARVAAHDAAAAQGEARLPTGALACANIGVIALEHGSRQ